MKMPILLLALFAPPVEETIDVLALHRKAAAEKKPIRVCYYRYTPPMASPFQKDRPSPLIRIPESKGWEFDGKADVKPGDLFRIVLGPRGQAPVLHVSQITGPNTFLDFQNKFLVEGIETAGLVDGVTIQGQWICQNLGYVKGSHTYRTEAGTNTVLHIILAESDEYTLTEKETKDGYRVWIAADGKTKTVGKPAGRKGNKIRMRDRQGKQHSLNVEDFSESDQEFIRTFKQ